MVFLGAFPFRTEDRTSVSTLIFGQFAGFIDDNRVAGGLNDRCPHVLLAMGRMMPTLPHLMAATRCWQSSETKLQRNLADARVAGDRDDSEA